MQRSVTLGISIVIMITLVEFLQFTRHSDHLILTDVLWTKWFRITCVCVCVCVCVCARSVVSDSLRPRGPQPARLLCPWDFSGKNTGVGSHFLLQGIFPSQGSNPHFLHLMHWQVDSLPLSHWGSSQNHGPSLQMRKGRFRRG